MDGCVWFCQCLQRKRTHPNFNCGYCFINPFRHTNEYKSGLITDAHSKKGVARSVLITLIIGKRLTLGISSIERLYWLFP